MHYIEGGWPGSNPKDVSFFEQAADLEWKNARIAAFGSTRRKDTPVEDDGQVRTLLEAKTPVITFFGKSWRLHVTEILGTTETENQAMIRDTTRYLKEHGRKSSTMRSISSTATRTAPNNALATLAAAKEAAPTGSSSVIRTAAPSPTKSPRSPRSS